jgi:hypothetical protein
LQSRNAKGAYFVEEDSYVVGNEDGSLAFRNVRMKKVVENKFFDSSHFCFHFSII